MTEQQDAEVQRAVAELLLKHQPLIEEALYPLQENAQVSALAQWRRLMSSAGLMRLLLLL